VLDMLVQHRRDTRAALRLMRKLLKKQGFAPKLLVTDKLRSYASASRRLGLTCPHEQSEQSGGELSSSGATMRAQVATLYIGPICSMLSERTLPFTTPSTSNAVSSRDRLCGFSEPRRSHNGQTPSQRLES